ncbi:MAG: sugar kinase [Bacteroidetes bacterium]|nr:sugar kinase [Bacteroidota bacterium]
MSLLVLGSVAFDAIETPFGKTDKIVGGSASYISLSASFFYNNLNLVSVVGGDFPTNFLNILNSRGIDTQGLQIKHNEKTFFWSGKYHNDMNSRDTLITELNVLGDFDPLLPEKYNDCKYLILGNLHPAVQSTLIERLKNKPELIVMDTMNFWISTAKNQLRDTLALTDVLIINDEEARQLSGEYSLLKASRIIRNMGPQYLVIKKGEHGALLFHKNEIFYCPALPLEEVFDPTGAGDTFAGGFTGYLAKTGDTSFTNMKKAVVYGSTMASFCVEKFGTEKLLELTDDNVKERLDLFLRLSDMGF